MPAARRRPQAGRLAAAAVIAVGIGAAAGYLAGRASRLGLPRPSPEGPAINVNTVELAPAADVRAGSATSKTVILSPQMEELILALDLPSGEKRSSRYALEVFNSAGTLFAARAGLEPTPLGTLAISFPRGQLAPGRYAIRVFGIAGDDSERRALRSFVAAYHLRLLNEAGAGRR